MDQDKGLSEATLRQRAKQLAYGRGTLGYLLSQHYKHTIKAPRPEDVCSKRAWDGRLRAWRRSLHTFDPTTEEEWRRAYATYRVATLRLAWELSSSAEEYTARACKAPPDILREALQEIHPF